MSEELVKSFSLNLRMGLIESGPPLSTILGNFGINTVKFCKELNEFTNLLPNFLVLEVKIFINSDKSYYFFICEPTVSLMLKLVSFKKEHLIKISGGVKSTKINVVAIRDIYLISYFKFNEINDILLKCIYGTLVSLGYHVSR